MFWFFSTFLTGTFVIEVVLPEVAVVLLVHLNGVVQGAGPVESAPRRVQVDPDLLVLQNESVEKFGKLGVTGFVIFLNGSTPASFCLFSFFLSTNFTETLQTQRPWIDDFILKMGHPRPLFVYFRSFSNKLQYNFTTNLCEKMSIQYTALGFEPTTLRMWVSSHNH